MIQQVSNLNYLSTDSRLISMMGSALYKEGFFIAGGSVWCSARGVPIRDIDIFSKTPGLECTASVLHKVITQMGLLCTITRVKRTPFACTYKVSLRSTITGPDSFYEVQCISPNGYACGEPPKVVDYFDIRNAALYIDANGAIKGPHINVTSQEEYVKSIINAKQVILGSTSNPAHTYTRALKYKERGLIINDTVLPQQLMKINTAIELNKIEQLIEYTVSRGSDEETYEGLTLDSFRVNINEANRYVESVTTNMSRVASGVNYVTTEVPIRTNIAPTQLTPTVTRRPNPWI